MSEHFQLLPGEKVLQIVGMPGPDTDDCEVISQDGDQVTIRFQVYGRGPWFEETVPLSKLLWLQGSDTSKRYRDWMEARK